MTNSTGLVARVAENIRAELARKQQTGAEMGRVLGISRTSAQHRLVGKTPFSLADLEVVSTWLGVPLEKLLAGEDAAGGAAA